MPETEERETTQEPEPEYWVVRDVANLLRLSEKSIYRIVQENPDFPHVRVGRGAMRFPRQRVLRWLARRTQGKA